MSDEPRLPLCYIIGGPEDGKKAVDQGNGEIVHLPVEPSDKFRYFYAYDAAGSTDERIIYQYVLPNVVAAILKYGKRGMIEEFQDYLMRKGVERNLAEEMHCAVYEGGEKKLRTLGFDGEFDADEMAGLYHEWQIEVGERPIREEA